MGKANAEGQKAIKRYQGQLRETIQGFEDQARGRQEVMEAAGIAERKAGALSGEVEESRALLGSADRTKHQLDSELADARTAVTEMSVINGKAMHDKRALESVIHTLQAEIDDALQAAKNSEDKSKTMSQLNLGQRGLLIPNLVNLKVAWLMLKPLP